MKLIVEIDGKNFAVDLSQGRSIAIELNFDGPQPNHFGVEKAASQTVEIGDFVGDTTRGGSCNVRQLSMIPHCNGTHTESVAHIVDRGVPIGDLATDAWFVTELVSVTPVAARDTSESYRPELDHHDTLVTRESLVLATAEISLTDVRALVIRTLPNKREKTRTAWGSPLHPAFLTVEAMQWVVQSAVDHLLLDMPSVDKMYDAGLLTNHHIFWNVAEGTHRATDETLSHKTITEMAFVNDEIADGRYLMNLQFAALESDASPSRPILYPLTPDDRP